MRDLPVGETIFSFRRPCIHGRGGRNIRSDFSRFLRNVFLQQAPQAKGEGKKPQVNAIWRAAQYITRHYVAARLAQPGRFANIFRFISIISGAAGRRRPTRLLRATLTRLPLHAYPYTFTLTRLSGSSVTE